jgi:hypothetical protein
MPVLIRTDAFRYTVRSIPWLPPVLAALLATLIVVMRHGHGAALPLQAISIALASGAGYALDDAAFEIFATSPHSLLRRRLERLAVVGPPVVLLWVVLLAWQGTAGSEETWALIAMFAGLLGLSVGIAGAASRRSRGHGGIAVAPTLFVALVLSTVLTPRWRPLPLGDIPGGWSPIYLRWTSACVVGLLVFLLSSRDLASRRA